MKQTNETQKMKSDESGFSAVLIVLMLIIVPALPLGKYGGGIAMVAVSVIGLIVYSIVYGGRLRSRGQLKTAAVIVGVSFAIGAILALALAFFR